MRLDRNIGLSLEILAAHKLRTLLSILGVVVGVGAVVLMSSVGKGAEKRILDRIKDMGTNLIVVNAGQTQLIAGRQRQMTTVTTLVPEDAEAMLKECPSVSVTAAAVSTKSTVRWEDETANTSVVGISPEGFRVRNITAASGRLFDADENKTKRRVAVIGPTVARNLFEDADPIGLQIRIGHVPFEVIGVTKRKGMDANGQDQDDLIIVPLETAMRRLRNVTYVNTIYAQGGSNHALMQAETEIRNLLRQRHRLTDKSDDFTIQNQATLIEAEKQTASSLSFLIGSVAAISLLVGSVGILAVMMMTIRERRKEIGLRRALGALYRDIRLQFLVEAVLLSGAGGIAGVLVGVILTVLVSVLGNWQAIMSWVAISIGLLVSITLGLVAGVYPALRAARLEPIEALRAN
jgi:putative ABC transport system permease protein